MFNELIELIKISINYFIQLPITKYNITYRLLQRYQNVKGELEAQHNLERVKLEKQIQTGFLSLLLLLVVFYSFVMWSDSTFIILHVCCLIHFLGRSLNYACSLLLLDSILVLMLTFQYTFYEYHLHDYFKKLI